MQCNQRIFRPLALVLVACVLIILVSAAQRLALYTDAFGFTLLRVMAIAFMVWLAGNIVSFAATVLRGRNQGFASGLVLSGVIAILLLGTINPAAVVARVNVERISAGNGIYDVDHLFRLGPDAVPVILSNFYRLAPESQCLLAGNLLNRYRGADPGQADWRTWNASVAAAIEAVEQHANELLAASRCELFITNPN